MGEVGQGELVYLPSNVSLYQYGEFDNSLLTESIWREPVSRFVVTEKPMNVLVLGHDSRRRLFQVLYKSEKWFVKAKDIFEIGEK